MFEDGEGSPSDFWKKLNDTRIRHIHAPGRHSAGVKHRAMLKLACGEYMAVFDDDDYYSAEYLGFMLRQLRASNVSLVKLGAWAAFQGHWEVDDVTKKSVLEGKFQQINVSTSFAALGYGFTYFFSRDAAEAKIHIEKPVGLHRPGWDGQWVRALLTAGIKVALVNNHPITLVIKVQHGSNVSRLLGNLVRRLEGALADHQRVLALLRETLPVKLEQGESKVLRPRKGGREVGRKKRNELARKRERERSRNGNPSVSSARAQGMADGG